MLENPKKYYGQMIASSVILSLIFFFIFFFVLFPSQNSYARVTGPCSNCHTMHNSQGGDAVEEFIPFENDGTANSVLLATTCIGCHTGNNTDESILHTPYVMGITEPIFGTNTLAGGNFWWVAQGNDNKGHNVAGVTGIIIPDRNHLYKGAPGQTVGTLGVCMPCHVSMEQGCQSCHLTPKHHANDDPDDKGTKLVDSMGQGWYRFLSSGHDTQKGVEGIEHEKWNYKADKYSHNEYLGNVYVTDIQNGGFGFSLGNTTTAFCTGCHGLFHDKQKDESDQWIRHPSDFKIPDSGEYTDAFGGEYDPYVPVARTSLAGGVSSEVTPGNDMVMCLSCHVAHGSPYPDMLRWNYDDMIAGTTNPAVQGTGCFKCHTEKDGGD